MAKDPEIIKKLSWIISLFPLEIDYISADKWVMPKPHPGLLKAILYPERVLKASVRERYRTFYNEDLPEVLITTFNDYLTEVNDLKQIIWFRFRHYYCEPDRQWDLKWPHDWYYYERSKQVTKCDPTKVPIDKLPDPAPNSTDLELRIYCERRVVLFFIDYMLMTDPDIINEWSPFGFSSITTDEQTFAEALSLEPIISETDFGKKLRIENSLKGKLILPSRPTVRRSLRKGVKRPGYNRNSSITPFARLLLIIKSHPRIRRSDFSISDFRKACLIAYYNGEISCDHKIPPTETLEPWFQVVFGKGKSNIETPNEPLDEEDADYIYWPWEIEQAAEKMIAEIYPNDPNQRPKRLPRSHRNS